MPARRGGRFSGNVIIRSLRFECRFTNEKSVLARAERFISMFCIAHALLTVAVGCGGDLGPIVGISLGTTSSSVGIYKNGRVTIIPDDQGNRITPAYVAFTDEELLIGEAAKAKLNTSRTLFATKRLLGRGFSDKSVQADRALLPYDIVEKDGKPMISAEGQGEATLLRPEEVSAMVLRRMKETAENYLGREVNYSVLTVPVHFNDHQRVAMREAGKLAGLEVLRVINEETAAAIAYNLDRKTEKNILMYKLGGATFNVALLTIDNGVFEVSAASGDVRLGGNDFDQRVTEHFMRVFQEKTGKDMSGIERAVHKLRRRVETAKRALSAAPLARLEIEQVPLRRRGFRRDADTRALRGAQRRPLQEDAGRGAGRPERCESLGRGGRRSRSGRRLGADPEGRGAPHGVFQWQGAEPRRGFAFPSG